MEKSISKRRTISIAVFYLFILIFGGMYIRSLVNGNHLSARDWAGVWDISYFYEHEPGLLYEGSLQVSLKDSIQGHLEVTAPMSNRSERITLSGLSVVEDSMLIRGEIVHNRYKIQGGFLRETFELQLKNQEKFEGRGWCTDFCAEGTQHAVIIWEGIKSN